MNFNEPANLMRATQLCAAQGFEPQAAALQVHYYLACGSKPGSLGLLGRLIHS